MPYIESGYVDSGYFEGDGGTLSVSSVKHFRVDVKKTSSKTKEEVLSLAEAEVEARQAQAGDAVAVYADVYDARDKTITRIFSNIAKSAGFGDGNIPFGGDVEQVTQEITNATTALAQEITNVNNSFAQEITRVDGMFQTALKPKLRLVNPFDALVLDTELTANENVYTFNFDTSAIGNGDYTLEISFEPTEAENG
jgi:hypothetical protein